MGTDSRRSLHPVERAVAIGTVLDSRVKVSDGGNSWTRIRLVRTPIQPRLVRVVEAWRKEDGADTGVCVNREMFLADQLIVRSQPGVQAGFLRAELRKLGVELGASIGEGIFISTLKEAGLDSVSNAMAELVKRSDLVETAEPDGVGFGAWVPDDPFFYTQWGLRNYGAYGGTAGVDVGASEFWDVAGQVPGIVVAVLDTGLNFGHLDLQGVEWINPKERPGNGIDDDGNGKVDDYHGWNFVSENGDPTDDHGHGSHVAGIIAAKRGNKMGMAGVLGEVRILPCKILNSEGAGLTSALVSATGYARRMGVPVMNMSLQNYPFSQLLSSEFDACEAAGIVICAAAGNQGVDNDKTPNYPSSYKHSNLIAVGNHDPSDKKGSSSNYGSSSVHLFAPGTAILSTVLGISDFEFYTGTSMAAPFVSAAVAAIKYANLSWKAPEIKKSILGSIVPGAAYSGFSSTAGRLNLCGALLHASRQVPLVIQSQPVEAAVVEGKSAVLTVSASGSRPIFFEWRKDNVALTGMTSPVLTLADVKLKDAGVYTVVVRNPTEAVESKPARLSVNVPASILTQPNSVAVTLGDTASFSVAASGTEPLSYQWRKEGVAISGATAPVFKVAGSQIAQAGSYDVVVTNFLGSVASRRVTLRVNEPVYFTRQPESFSVNFGAVACFSVAAGGTEPLTYQWRKDGVPIAGANAASLKISAVTSLDTGSYDVMVGNVAGEVRSNSATLRTNVPVSITQQPVSASFDFAASARLQVRATGTPPLRYQWRRNGVPVSGATGEGLDLVSVTEKIAGSYDVVVSNPAGTVCSTVAQVSVRGAVEITSHPTSERHNTGADGAFHVEATGAGPLSYRWRKNGIFIPGANGATLPLSKLSHKDIGVYDVLVSNAFSAATSSQATLKIDVVILRGYSAFISLNVPSQSSSDSPVSAQLFRGSQAGGPQSVGPAVRVAGGTVRMNLRSVTESGEYMVRFFRALGEKELSFEDSVPFGIDVRNGSEMAGSYEALLETDADEAPDFASSRGVLQLTVSPAGRLSGRLRYIEAPPLLGAAGEKAGGRMYVPVERSFAGELVEEEAGSSAPAFSADLGTPADKGRQVVSLKMDFRSSPAGLSVEVKDRMSGVPAVWTLSTAKKQRPTVRISPSGGTRGLPRAAELVGRYTHLAERVANGTDNFAYVHARVSASGAVVWTVRLPGLKAAGASMINTDNSECPELPVFYSQRASGVSFQSSDSILGRLCFVSDRQAGGGALAGAAMLKGSLERHSSYANKRSTGEGLLPVYSADLKMSVLNGVRKTDFLDGESVRWAEMKNGALPSFFVPTVSGRFMRLILKDPLPDARGQRICFEWNVCLSESGALWALPVSGTGSPELNLRFDKLQGEIRGTYVFLGDKRSVYGTAIPAPNSKQVGRGWVEAGASPLVKAGEWILMSD